jgi:hypothetical protein
MVIATANAAQQLAPVRQSKSPIDNVAGAREIADRNKPAISQIIKRQSPAILETDRKAVSAEQVERALNSFPQTNIDGCFITGSQSKDFKHCIYGEGDGLIALVGSSHSNQFFSPIRDVASRLKSRLLVHTRSGCTLADVTYTLNGGIWKACNSWKSSVMSDLLRSKPDLVVMVPRFQTVVDPVTGREAERRRQVHLFLQGVERTSQILSSHGIRVLLIGDTPGLKYDPLDCLSSRVVAACDQVLGRVMQESTTQLMNMEPTKGIVTADITRAICSNRICSPVRSGHIVWRDRDHVTNAYAQLLTGMFESLVKVALNGVIVPQ